MKRIFALAVVAASIASMSGSVGAAHAADAAALKAEAVSVVQSFGGPLKEALTGAMTEGGPVHAISACNTQAPDIAHKAAADSGWSVGRTSLKLRNTDNKPDAWELATLQEFEARRAAGESPDAIAKAEIVDDNGHKTFRFMKAIGTAEVCLNCHGADLKPEVASALDDLYPEDAARGFSTGDIRGAFTLKKAL